MKLELDGLAITEEQKIVYREEPDRSAPPPVPQPAPVQALWKRTITPDPVLLCGTPSADGKSAKRWVTNHEGTVALIADAEFR